MQDIRLEERAMATALRQWVGRQTALAPLLADPTLPRCMRRSVEAAWRALGRSA